MSENFEKNKEILNALDTMRTEIEGKMDAIGKDVAKKAEEDMTKMLSEKQEAELKEKAETKARMDAMELELARKGSDGNADLKEYKNQFGLYMRKGKKYEPTDSEIKKACDAYMKDESISATKEEKEMQVKAMVEGSNPDGGYLVLPERDSRIRKRMFETSPVRAYANVRKIAGNMFEILGDDEEFGAGRVGETESRPETTTSGFFKIEIPLHEYYAMPGATQVMLDDTSFNIEGHILNKATNKIVRMQNYDFILGNGSKRPKGLFAYTAATDSNTYERGKIGQRTSTTSGTISADDIIDLMSDLKTFYQPNAKLFGTRKTLGYISKLKDNQGVYLFDRQAFIANGMKPVINGKPYVEMADIAEITNSALALGYGDLFESYQIIDNIGVRLLRDPYTAKPYVLFYTTMRTGGAVVNFDSFKILKVKA